MFDISTWSRCETVEFYGTKTSFRSHPFCWSIEPSKRQKSELIKTLDELRPLRDNLLRSVKEVNL